MQRFLLCLAITILTTYTANAFKKGRILHSPTAEMLTDVNNVERKGWTVSPQLKPDQLMTECGKGITKVKFISQTDSVEYDIRLGDTVRFYVLVPGMDSALTEIVGVPKNVNFSDEYIKQHKNKIEVEIPVVQELALIAIALTNTGMSDSNMVDMETSYYAEVMKHFKHFKNHPLIDTLNKQMARLNVTEQYWYYYAWKMAACGYYIHKADIAQKGIILNMAVGYPQNPLPANLHLLNDFAKQSKFWDFYMAHKPYYNGLIETYNKLNPISKMQQWLQHYFKREYGSYVVYFSPLVGGAHSTERYADNGFTQTVMFVCAASPSPKNNAAVSEMQESRVVFTEIDHNFVNPVSANYLPQLSEVFGKRTKWVDTTTFGTSGYSNYFSVFNEYMTWGVFSLYCMDNYEAKDYDVMIDRMEKQMEKSRGFIRFKAFNRQLMALYKVNPKITVDELYKEMLDWSKKQPD